MKKRQQRQLNKIVVILTLVAILTGPINVFATSVTVTPIPSVQAEADTAVESEDVHREDRTSELDNIREERELNREEGARSGEVLDVMETTVASILANGPLSQEQKAEVIGRLAQRNYQTSGILASVVAAQCILETGWLDTSLAVEANNCFGMKATLSGNTWPGTSWTGEIYRKQTWEDINGVAITIMADFRAYPSIEQSLADHTAYLLGAETGNGLRYPGIRGELDYRNAIQIIKNGGYATDSRYVDKICSIIERYHLTQYDVIDPIFLATQKPLELFRIRKSWDDVDSQLGAFLNLENAKKACLEGYKIFDPDGEMVFEG